MYVCASIPIDLDFFFQFSHELEIFIHVVKYFFSNYTFNDYVELKYIDILFI